MSLQTIISLVAVMATLIASEKIDISNIYPKIKRPRLYLDQIAEATVQSMSLCKWIVVSVLILAFISMVVYDISKVELSGINLISYKLFIACTVSYFTLYPAAFYLSAKIGGGASFYCSVRYRIKPIYYFESVKSAFGYLILGTMLLAIANYVDLQDDINATIRFVYSIQLSLPLVILTLPYLLFKMIILASIFQTPFSSMEIQLVNGELIKSSKISSWYESKDEYRIWELGDKGVASLIIPKTSVAKVKILSQRASLSAYSDEWKKSIDKKVNRIKKEKQAIGIWGNLGIKVAITVKLFNLEKSYLEKLKKATKDLSPSVNTESILAKVDEIMDYYLQQDEALNISDGS